MVNQQLEQQKSCSFVSLIYKIKTLNELKQNYYPNLHGTLNE